MALHLVAVAAKDGTGTTIPGGIDQNDTSGTGAGPNVPVATLIDSTANEILGTTAGAAVTTNANGSLQQYLRGLVTLLAAAVGGAGGALFTKLADGAGNLISSTANALNVNVANASLTVAVSNAVSALLQATTSGGALRSRTIIPNNVNVVVVKSAPGQVYKIRATNNSGTILYVKLYDAVTATAGAGTPVDTLMIPGDATDGAGISDEIVVGAVHSTGICFIVTAGIADTDTSLPPANACIVTVFYK